MVTIKHLIGRSAITTGVLALAAATLLVPSTDHQSESTKDERPTTAELAAWKAATATPAQRAAMADKLTKSFAGVASVSTSDDTGHGTGTLTYGGKSVRVSPTVALGVTGDHFWITASYADMARGGIWGAVGVCISNGIPTFVCNSIGWTLSTWSQGWGSANNHGVWAAAYWWPPHFNGGRW